MAILDVAAHRTGSVSPGGRPGRQSTRALRVLGWILIWSGVLVMAFLAYQLWGTGLYNQRAQQRLEGQLVERLAVRAVAAPAPPAVDQSEASGPPVTVPPPDTISPPPPLVEEAAPPEGEPIGRIVIPTAEVDDIMVEGVGRSDLKKGPGHMPRTPLPGQPGNSVVSGHRTTYGAPFFNLDQVAIGDDIHVDTLIGRHTYRVREILVVEPTDVWVTDPRPASWLTTCTPRYSAAQRLVIVAELVDGPNLAAVAAGADRPGARAGGLSRDHPCRSRSPAFPIAGRSPLPQMATLLRRRPVPSGTAATPLTARLPSRPRTIPRDRHLLLAEGTGWRVEPRRLPSGQPRRGRPAASAALSPAG